MSAQFFVKDLLRRRSGWLNVGLSVTCGLIGGVLLPLVVTGFLSGLVSSERQALWQLFANMTTVAALSSVATFFQWRAETVSSVTLRLHTVTRFANKLRGNAYAAPGGFEFGQAIQASTTAGTLVGGNIPALAVSVGGFLTLLLMQRLPWWVYVAFVIIAVSSAGIYWRLKDVTIWRGAAGAEGESVGHLSVLAQEPNTQVQPALLRAVFSSAHRAVKKRRYAYMHITQGVVISRIGLEFLLVGLAGLTAVLGKPESGMLFVVFALTFRGHILQMQYILEAFRNVVADSAGVVKVLNAPKLPELQPKVGCAILLTRGMKVTYSTDAGLEKTVEIPDIMVLPGGLKILDGPNGCGKTTLIMGIGGQLPTYEGSVKVCGSEVKGQDTRKCVVTLRQHHIKYAVPVKDLFVDAAGHVFKGLRKQALAWATVDFPLDMLHSELSGGQRQKANLALCFYEVLRRAEVRLVLLDEPTNHLDGPSQAAVAVNLVEFVQAVRDAECAVVVATHAADLQKALKNVL